MLSSLLAGCGDAPPTPFTGNPEASPFVETKSVDGALPEGPFCKPDASGVYPKSLTYDDFGQKSGNFFATGGGCLHAPLEAVWARAQKAEATNWREADQDSYSAVQDSRANFVFRAVYSAGPFLFRQSWAMDWLHSLTAGTLDAPEAVVIHYKKTQGTGHIPHWEGTISLKYLLDGVTSFAMHNEIRGTQIDVEKAKGAVRDIFAGLHALP